MNTGYNRLRTMAEAYSQPGTGLTGDTGLRDAVIAGLDHLHADVFNETTARYGNWWNWQIGAPQALMDTCVLLHDDLTDAQRAAYCKAVDTFLPDSAVGSYTGTSTGANRVDLCRGIILRGIVGANPAKIALAVAALSPVFPYVTTGDGFYPDGSFVQHTSIPYIGGYGAVLNDGLGRLFALLRGSTWEITDPGSRQFLDTIDAAIAPFIYDGLMMDNVSGRGITRVGSSDHTRAHGVMASIVLLGMGAGPEENARWRAMVKGWLKRDYYAPALKSGSLSLVNTARLQTLLDDTSVTASPEPSAHRVFHNMDRATHRRRGWGAGLSMASGRIAHYEFGNGENKRGWHTGSGWLQWWGDGAGLEQYSDVLADRRPVPAARHHRLPEEAHRRAGRRLGQPEAGHEVGRRHRRRRVRHHRPAPPGPGEHDARPQVVVLARRLRGLPRLRHHPPPTARASRRSSTTAASARAAHRGCCSTARHSPPLRAGPPPAPPPGPTSTGTPATSSPAVPNCTRCARNAPVPGRTSTTTAPPPPTPAATSPSGRTTAPTRRTAATRTS